MYRLMLVAPVEKYTRDTVQPANPAIIPNLQSYFQLPSNVRYCARYTAAADVQSASDDFDEWEIKLKGLNKGSTLCHLYDLSGLTDASIIMHLALLIAGVATSPLFKIIKADA